MYCVFIALCLKAWFENLLRYTFIHTIYIYIYTKIQLQFHMYKNSKYEVRRLRKGLSFEISSLAFNDDNRSIMALCCLFVRPNFA